MRVLLDTHALLWWVDGSPHLTDAARRAIIDAEACFVSIASAWELAVKASPGRIRLAAPVADYLQAQLRANQFHLLPVNLSHLAVLETLPWHHRDPFDRLLVAQATTDHLTIVTRDESVRKYPVPSIW